MVEGAAIEKITLIFKTTLIAKTLVGFVQYCILRFYVFAVIVCKHLMDLTLARVWETFGNLKLIKKPTNKGPSSDATTIPASEAKPRSEIFLYNRIVVQQHVYNELNFALVLDQWFPNFFWSRTICGSRIFNTYHLVPGKVNVSNIIRSNVWKTIIDTNATWRNGCEKVLWSFLEIKEGRGLHKNSGIY